MPKKTSNSDEDKEYLNYIDQCIRHWRKKRKEGERGADIQEESYQVIRVEVAGERLGDDDGPDE